ncbi:uncharacterized protein BDZ99DRAFT_478204 [Mytilinidion resinicola]|uniref:Uncharacterized protein n=1 Tax=Mytilinidion resinicola TaxID=574789 RepID=A0A6A6YGJ1_9PEZI|nr:uncharacterized protein BDZ99DRAFT_478204 [Mytilinidion resinicola]KAF2807653.1 hypothetical protein BDZ99DRAFT_478204 [Mytilinidion resinicola]
MAFVVYRRRLLPPPSPPSSATTTTAAAAPPKPAKLASPAAPHKSSEPSSLDIPSTPRPYLNGKALDLLAKYMGTGAMGLSKLKFYSLDKHLELGSIRQRLGRRSSRVTVRGRRATKTRSELSR